MSGWPSAPSQGKGYEIGSGFIVGLPGQTVRPWPTTSPCRELRVGHVRAGPFLPQADTPWPRGPRDEDITLRCWLCCACLSRVIYGHHGPGQPGPRTRATSALRAGCNVIMPIYPRRPRKHYRIYDHKEAWASSRPGRDTAGGAPIIRDGGLKSHA
jgi:biotin synthase